MRPVQRWAFDGSMLESGGRIRVVSSLVIRLRP
jgi:hypothetical protein